jgi:hypothetical protein
MSVISVDVPDSMSASLFFALPSSCSTSRRTSSRFGQMTAMSCATYWWVAMMSVTFMYRVGFVFV